MAFDFSDWTRVVFTVKVGSAPKIYTNGTLVFTAPDILQDMDLSSFSGFKLFHSGYGDQTIDDLKIFDSELSPEQVAALE